MVRAGVFIGVDRTGQLQELHDAAKGAGGMHAWAVSQGMRDGTHAKLITDAGGGKVDPDVIHDAIKEIIDGPGVDQLIVYFAGHGVNINRTEQWLLSDAPVRTSAAVNVSGSVELARYCGIRHVVVISDACRVAPEGIQAQNVRGVDIFPNDGAGGRAQPVDQFFACVLGKTASEVRDPADAVSAYCALYTGAVLDALSGARPEVLEPSAEPGDSARYVKPVGLQTYLEREVPARLRAMGLTPRTNQDPDALLMAHSNWLARIMPGSVRDTRSRPTAEANRRRPETLGSVTRRLVRPAASGDQQELGQELFKAAHVAVPGAESLAGSARKLIVPFGPDHFETECGVKVQGNRIDEFLAPGARCELVGTEGDILRVHPGSQRAINVLLRFDRVGTVVPALPGFVAAVTFDDAELVDVAYEPSSNTARAAAYGPSARRLRSFRAVAAAAAQQYRFQIDPADAESLPMTIRHAGGIDPTLALYAAYACHDVQADRPIRELAAQVRDELGVALFDIALLSRSLIGEDMRSSPHVVPFFPLLARGWSLLRAHRVSLPPALDGIERTMRDSPWSLFDAEGVERLRRALGKGGAR